MHKGKNAACREKWGVVHFYMYYTNAVWLALHGMVIN